MKKLLFTLSAIPLLLSANFTYKKSPITPKIKQRMINGNSYRAGCPVPLSQLRYLQLKYIGFDNKEHTGELIVNQSVANDVVAIFKKLYEIRYPIRMMQLVSNYNGSDFASIEADNTSAFNCRNVDGTNRWSKHSFGKAIDINPIENPYVSRSGHISHKKSLPFALRAHQDNSAAQRAVILNNDPIVKIFKSHGWRWGGNWHSIKDYQHFDKK